MVVWLLWTGSCFTDTLCTVSPGDLPAIKSIVVPTCAPDKLICAGSYAGTDSIRRACGRYKCTSKLADGKSGDYQCLDCQYASGSGACGQAAILFARLFFEASD